jgi:hypothetical protein
MIYSCSLMVACTSRRFHRWFTVDSEFHTAQSYGHTVNNTVHTVQYDAYDRIIFLVMIRFVRTLDMSHYHETCISRLILLHVVGCKGMHFLVGCEGSLS